MNFIAAYSFLIYQTGSGYFPNHFFHLKNSFHRKKTETPDLFFFRFYPKGVFDDLTEKLVSSTNPQDPPLPFYKFPNLLFPSGSAQPHGIFHDIFGPWKNKPIIFRRKLPGSEKIV